MGLSIFNQPQWVSDGFLLPSEVINPRIDQQQAKSDIPVQIRSVVRKEDVPVPATVYEYVASLCRHNCLKILGLKGPNNEHYITPDGRGRIYIDPDMPPIEDSDLRRMDRFGFTEISWTLAA